MSAQKRLIIAVLAIVGLFAVAVFFALERLADPFLCGRTVHAQKPSPDKTFTAVVFDIDCGVTTGFNTQLSIVQGNESFSPRRHPAILILNGIHQLDLNWTSENALSVRSLARENALREAQPENGVRVVYDWVTLTTDDAQAVQVVDDHIRKTRKWPRDSYYIKLNRRDGDTLDVWVIHKDDEADWKRAPYFGGGGKSFTVEVDAKSLRVIRELGFQ